MIVYLVKKESAYTIRDYLDWWAPSLSSRFEIVYYERLPHIRDLPVGPFIFSDHDRLSPSEVAMAERLWEQVSSAAPDLPRYNHPRHCMRRYELLRSLHDAGYNDFRAHRLPETRVPPRFPVFLRREDEHSGPMTPLLRSQEEIERAMVRLFLLGFSPRELLMVEFCDTSDRAGLFRKYSAQVVGPHIIPRHLYFSDHWAIKTDERHEERMLAEELEYLETNPHEEQLRKIAERARIDYGRIDYGLLDGSIRVWEINTNPQLLRSPDHYHPDRLPAQELFVSRISRLFAEIDVPTPAHVRIPLAVAPSVVQGVDRERRKSRLRRYSRRVAKRHRRLRRVVLKASTATISEAVILGPLRRPLVALLRRRYVEPSR